MDGRRLDGYTISSPCEPKGSGELKMANSVDPDQTAPLGLLVLNNR